MGLARRLRDLCARRFGTWSIDDPRPRMAASPYTYYLPSEEMLAAIAPGDRVKAIFRPRPADREYDAERMWVKVAAVSAEILTGELDNEPFDIPQLRVGCSVMLPRSHVIDIDWADGHTGPQPQPKRWYWERCFVDDCVAEGRSRIDYLYREEPDMAQEGDVYPDSGWRIRGTQDEIDADASAGRKPQYIAIGAVLNMDDRWIDLIDEPVGEHFRWWEDEQSYVRVTEVPDES